MKKYLFTLLTGVLIVLQQTGIAQTSPQQLEQSYTQRKTLEESSIFKNYPVRNIGPVVQGGRVSDIAVNTENTKEYYIAYASGGIFKTINNGISFEPIFDNQDALGIGDMALSASNPDVIYVGTGEKNSSRSSYTGSGVYKSIDAGMSWQYLGLSGIQHTARVIIHPANPDIVWVAALGALYTHNEHRGVYKTIDGGQSWDKTLYVNDSTGIVDLVINPNNPDQLWASSWERTRKAWHFKGNGPGSAIYRSDDGGATWIKKTEGFTSGNHVGRIGIDVSSQNPNVLYALLDNQDETKDENKIDDDEKLSMQDFIDMNKEAFLVLDDEKLGEFLKDLGYPNKYTAEKVKNDIKDGVYTVEDIANYFGDANDALFNTKVTGAELYRSINSGDSWKKINSYNLDGVYFTYGYYFGEVKIDPSSDSTVYIFGVPLLKSKDSGSTYSRIDKGNVHVDHQALWVDPNDGQHLLLGNDGGLYESYDEGTNWHHINNTSVGQFYTVNVDMAKPYNVYGGLQDNGTLVGSSKSVPNKTKHWDRLFGGDGMFVSADPRDNDRVYVGFQFGNYYRKEQSEGKSSYITPKHDIGAEKLRFNWRTPLVMSSHNSDILYIGAQQLYRSLDKGDNWEQISSDLTNNHEQGNVPFSTITTISESPLKFGQIYIGTDDGNVQLTESGGGIWSQITKGLPESKWVSSIHPSSHNVNEVYVTLNGYRDDEFNTYVYASNDKGKTWKSLKNNLPETVINVIIQDPVNQNLLYLGTDHGTYISLNKGLEWHYMAALPNVSSYDMVVHPRDNELVVATHGRGIYVMDVKPLQQLDPNDLITTFEISEVKHSKKWGERRYPYSEPNEPKAEAFYYLKKAGKVTVQIFKDDELIQKDEITGEVGFSTYNWDLKGTSYSKKGKPASEPKYVEKGKYKIMISTEGRKSTTTMEVK